MAWEGAADRTGAAGRGFLVVAAGTALQVYDILAGETGGAVAARVGGAIRAPLPAATANAAHRRLCRVIRQRDGGGAHQGQPRGNRAAPLAETGLGIRFPKGKSTPIFRNRPLPEIAGKRSKSARLLPYVLSSKGAEKFPKGKSEELLYTGIASNPASVAAPGGGFAAVI